MTSAKVAGANALSWAGTYLAVIKLTDVAVMVAILSGLGSFALSVMSIWWIRKQSKQKT